MKRLLIFRKRTMNDFFSFLFQYLEKEKIPFDKPEFLFQIQSHPNYPSLLAISETLSFFKIENMAARVEFSEIDNMPDRFITLLSENLSVPHFYFIEKKDNSYFCTKDKNTIEVSKSVLETRWTDMVLLAENRQIEDSLKIEKLEWNWVLLSLFFVLFGATLFLYGGNLRQHFFLVFPTIGIFLSIAAFNDFFGKNSKSLNGFCNKVTSNSCTSIVNHDRWKIFKLFNFIDLSILFFTSQFLGLFILTLSGDSVSFFMIQKIILLISLPVILISLYFQKNVEKNWYSICLMTIGVVLFEMIYCVLFQMDNFIISYKSVFVFSLVFSTVSFVWYFFKKILMERKEFKFKANSFRSNYEIFKILLKQKERISLPYTPIILGNKESKTQITIITNPFCGPCKDVHEILDKILEKHEKYLQVKIIFKTDIDIEGVENKKFFRALMGVYFEKGETQFREVLNYWFKVVNVNDWMQFFKTEADVEKVEAIYNLQSDWCRENSFSYTPVIFINGYEYPSVYDRENLYFFINELIEDVV